jgi:hypothetical protein
MKRVLLVGVALTVFCSQTPAKAVDNIKQQPATTEETLPDNTKQIIKELKSAGIKQGKYVWLKDPRWDIPVLTRLKIMSIKSSKEEIANPAGYNGPQRYLNGVSVILTTDDGKENTVSFDEQSDINQNINVQFLLYDPIKKWGKKFLEAVRKHKIMIGMSKDQTIVSWGFPDTVNKTVGSWGTHDQWVYGNKYVYFENGRLTSWQN